MLRGLVGPDSGKQRRCVAGSALRLQRFNARKVPCLLLLWVWQWLGSLYGRDDYCVRCDRPQGNRHESGRHQSLGGGNGASCARLRRAERRVWYIAESGSRERRCVGCVSRCREVVAGGDGGPPKVELRGSLGATVCVSGCFISELLPRA